MEQNSQRPSDLQVVKDLAFDLLKRNSLEDLLWDLAEAIGRLPGFEDSVVYLVDGRVLLQMAAFGPKTCDRQIVDSLPILMGQGIVGAVAISQVAEVVADTRLDSRYILDQHQALSELTVPVVFEGRTLAVLDTESSRLDAYSVEHLEILQMMANIAAPRIASAIRLRETQAARRELAELNCQLDQRVRERTKSLHAATTELQAQRDRLDSVLQAVEGGVLALDRHFCVESVNQVGTVILGFPSKAILSQSVQNVFRLRGVSDTQSYLLDLCEKGIVDETLVLADGHEIDIRCAVNRISDSENVGYVIAFRDCREENLLREQVVRSQRLESLGNLAAGIAHDFNNYLTAIACSIESANIRADQEDICSVLQVASEACIQARQLSQRFLTYSRGGEPIRQATELRGVIDSAIALATSGRTVNVSVHLDCQLRSVFVDRGQLIQVLSNVLLNAVQATSTGGRISVTAEPADQGLDRVRISIADNGPGLKREVIERVFDPYFTTRSEGAGIGLTTSHFILKAHGGTIFARNSRLLGGAEFVIEFPMGDSQLIEASTSQNGPEIKHDLRILVLDDEPSLRRVILTLLNGLGHQTEAVPNIVMARTCMQKACDDGEPFDVAIIDLTLGTESGIDAVKQLKEISPKTRFIVSSGYSNASVMADHQAFGFDGVLPKPYTAVELEEQLYREKE